MSDNWEGAHNQDDHRTTGGRAWCRCGEWCYPDDWCACCHEAAGHEWYDPTVHRLVPVGETPDPTPDRIVIERDENGKWPEWAITAVAVRLIRGHHLRHFPPFGEYALACEALDALAAGGETDG